MAYSHTPVLLEEVVYYLDLKPSDAVVDATLGGGGYSHGILKQIGSSGKLLAIDLDQAAIDNFRAQVADAKSKQVILSHANFTHIDALVTKHKLKNIQGIVADIGLSSFQLDAAGRGISFQKREPLDMRFDAQAPGVDAKFIINQYTQAQLITLFKQYGEEKFAPQIARKIVQAREDGEIRYTDQLVELIKSALPKPVQHKYQDSCRRIFQAIRIAVNHELENLETFLPKALDVLAPGGRLVVVTFHSLEDRIVKQFFVAASRGCVCPIDFPECRCGKNPQAKMLTKKPVIASAEEQKTNPRSLSAKLRALQKI
jgi:16S rRNA (cytosine1402-N4)-methyltransferase